jgi:hypothetical protein
MHDRSRYSGDAAQVLTACQLQYLRPPHPSHRTPVDLLQRLDVGRVSELRAYAAPTLAQQKDLKEVRAQDGFAKLPAPHLRINVEDHNNGEGNAQQTRDYSVKAGSVRIDNPEDQNCQQKNARGS